MNEKKKKLQEKELSIVSGGGGDFSVLCIECGKRFNAEGNFIQEKKGCLKYTYLVCPYCGEKYPW